MNTAELLVKCLEEEGVKYIFGIPGEENLEIINALEKSDIEFIVARHEQGAAFMADVYGRLTGTAGICLATLGPGATNLMTGVADANSDGAPLIALTGQVGTERMHLTSHQFLDLVKMFEPITKKSKQVVRPDTVNEIVRIAFKHAESEKPGACLIDLPVNISKMPVSEGEQPLKKQYENPEFADLTAVQRAAKLISDAKSPVIFIGSSAVRANASKAITDFVNTFRIPAVNTMMSKGVVSFDNPYSMWTIGIPQHDYSNLVMDNADLIIAIGYDLVEYAPNKWNRDPDRKIIHIDSRPAMINKLYQPEVEVVGDISNSVSWIQSFVKRTSAPAFDVKIKEKMAEEFAAHDNDESFPLKPQRILSDIRKVLDKDDILISDVGAHKMWIARQYHCYEPNTCIISNGFATMGIAVPGAVAAKLLNPDKRVLAVTGDGGFMMNSQEIETAVRIGTPIVILVFRDESYGLIKWKQMDQYGKYSCVDFGGIDYVKYAESFGGKGYLIESAAGLIPALEDAFMQKVPCIIDCPVNYAENEKLSEHLKNLTV
ncbi:MAG: acetolactate synthase large subunit [Eubacteriales bacterium]|nr:acetolactate synthase large subunit [Eubacteriales bacterium]